MPIIKVNGGYKYGKHGKLYKGIGAKAKAQKQGHAIALSEARASGHNIPYKRKNGRR